MKSKWIGLKRVSNEGADLPIGLERLKRRPLSFLERLARKTNLHHLVFPAKRIKAMENKRIVISDNSGGSQNPNWRIQVVQEDGTSEFFDKRRKPVKNPILGGIPYKVKGRDANSIRALQKRIGRK